ncbi:hypothetical protein RRG08_013720 [Elysia crispata]|uniref:Uncharacterized protein n=1 Tax=Elysia crispata TaxID=231223 RepID=A0AAE0Z9T1_9GAST|nr:hypothetical protein RRG08_013720 [Elysia crispata]
MCIDLDFNLYRVSCQSVVCFLGQTLRFGLISDVIICSGSQLPRTGRASVLLRHKQTIRDQVLPVMRTARRQAYLFSE